MTRGDGQGEPRTGIGRAIAIGLIRGYQRTLGVWIGGRCRFYPSCSAYAEEAFARYRFWPALRMTCRRVGRCHPWGGHGVDPVPWAGSGCAGEGGCDGRPIGAEPGGDASGRGAG